MMFLNLLIILYAAVLGYFTLLWSRNISVSAAEKKILGVSVVIPFRNEEHNLIPLINSLTKTDYPHHLLNFIFVNDHSQDASLKILNASLQSFPFRYEVISLSDNSEGKKSALIQGISYSDAELILTTDADCYLPANWVREMQAPFHNPSIQLVSGSVVFKAKNFLSKVFQMEFAPLIGVGAISIQKGNATMANGANLAFRRNTFILLQPFEDNLHIPTGDDIFLLQKISSKYPQGVYFQKSAVVVTGAPSLREFVNQRIRWASKWKAASERKSKIPAIAVWSFHLLYLIALGTLFQAPQNVFLLLAVMAKAVAEYIFIHSILRDQQQKTGFLPFCFLQFFYSIYVVLFGLLANFATYQWKGRNYGKYDR
ncbi:hypothetical protein C9994_07605 [Marivirga lumbricoides]|uniref:Glycosyltransferase 2-like domain-containing protein n=1 Tax=Marivirga lumbricoides TaxID=1046115 RepID=A0A2T4DRI8_9BACT|nr:hypothetical protein C9994_07605 [Marivirga lumbricoides]